MGVISQASPDLITMLYTSKENLAKLPFTSLLIGCGIDRQEESSKIFADVFGVAEAKDVPLVIDADGIFFLMQLLKRTNFVLG